MKQMPKTMPKPKKKIKSIEDLRSAHKEMVEANEENMEAPKEVSMNMEKPVKKKGY